MPKCNRPPAPPPFDENDDDGDDGADEIDGDPECSVCGRLVPMGEDGTFCPRCHGCVCPQCWEVGCCGESLRKAGYEDDQD